MSKPGVGTVMHGMSLPTDRMAEKAPAWCDPPGAWPHLLRRRDVRHSRRPNGLSLAEAFWTKVQPGAPDECWEWQGTRHVYTGYPVLSYKLGNRKAHRVSWEIHNGPIPEGLFVCHHCDNPPCVNPAHLFLGTAGDNNRDRDAKGRSSGGSRPGAIRPEAKLTDEDVRDMRRRWDAGEPPRSIARDYPQVHPGYVRVVISNRKRWAHVK